MKIRSCNFFEYNNNFVKYENVYSRLIYGANLNNYPCITIAIPTYRRPELLKEALESAINQENYDDYEVVIVDNDASGEFTAQITAMLKSLECDRTVQYYVNQDNIGPFGNWNRCIELSKGKWITILSDDDVLFPNYLSKMYEVIDDNPNISRVECKYLSFWGSNTIKTYHHGVFSRFIRYFKTPIFKVSFSKYRYGNFTGPHSQLFQKDLAIELGGYNEKFYPIGDYVFNALYVFKFPDALYVNQYLCGYRQLCNDTMRKIVQFSIQRKDIEFQKFLFSLEFSSVANFYICIKTIIFILRIKNNSFLKKVIINFLSGLIVIIKIIVRYPIIPYKLYTLKIYRLIMIVTRTKKLY